MCVNIKRYTYCGMPQIVLNFFRRKPHFVHQGSAGVAQIVKAYFAKSVLFEKLRKSIFDIPWLETVAHFVGEHVIDIVHIVAVSANLAVLLLHFPPSKELFAHGFRHRKTAVARFCLCAVCGDNYGLTVDARVCDCVIDGDFVFLEINGFPAKPQYLASAQSEQSRNVNQKPKLVVPRFLYKQSELFFRVRRTFKSFCAWRVYLFLK